MKGFCANGPNCNFGHPKWELPTTKLPSSDNNNQSQTNQINIHQNRSSSDNNNNQAMPMKNKTGYRPLSTVTCYKCRQLGHYADKCPNPRKE